MSNDIHDTLLNIQTELEIIRAELDDYESPVTTVLRFTSYLVVIGFGSYLGSLVMFTDMLQAFNQAFSG